MYKRVYIDLYAYPIDPENSENISDVEDHIHTLSVDNVEDPFSDKRVESAILEIYKTCLTIDNMLFSFINVVGYEVNNSDEIEFFRVDKETLSSSYGLSIIEYDSIWTDRVMYL